MTNPSGNMRIISVTTGTRDWSSIVVFMSVIIPFDTGGILLVAGVTAAILTCLKKRREVYIRIWVSPPITKDSSTGFLD